MAAAAPPTTQDDSAALLDHLTSNGSKPAAPPQAAPLDESAAFLDHLTGSGATPSPPAAPRPPRAAPPQPATAPRSQGGFPPVLPPVNPETVVPPVTPAPGAGRAAPAPGQPPKQVAVAPAASAAEKPLSKGAPTGDDQRRMLGLTLGQDMAPLGPPTGTPPARGKPVTYAGTPPEDALHAADRAVDTLPAFVHQPGYHGAEGGPVALLQQKQRVATVSLARVLPNLWQQWSADADAFKQRAAAYAQYLKANAGQLDAGAAARLEGVRQQLQADQAKLTARQQQLHGYDQRVAPVVSSGTPIHSGYLYPQERVGLAPTVGQEFYRNLWNSPLGSAAGFIPFAGLAQPVDPQALKKARAALMLTGAYPPLPDLPGRTPAARQQQIDQKNTLIPLLERLGPGQTPAAALKAYPSLTPWQRQLVPVLQQQIAAEHRAYQLVQEPRDLANVVASGLGLAAGGLAHGMARQWLSRRLGGLLEEPVTALLTREGPKVALARIATQGAAESGAAGLGGAAGGGAGAAGATLATGGNLPQAATALKEGAVSGAKVGSLLGALGWGAAASKSALTRPYSPEQAATIAARAQRVAQQRGYPAEEVEGIRQRVQDLARAPAFMKYGLAQDLADRINFLESRNVTPPEAPAPAPPAPPPAPAAEPTAPGSEPRITTSAGSSVSLRHMTPATVRAMGEDAAARGDAATATQAAQWLQAHAAHEAHANALVPPEQVGAYAAARAAPGNAALVGVRQIQATAAKVRTDDPDLAAKLDEAATTGERDWRRDWLAKTVPPAPELTPPPAPPVQAAVWRRLTPEQQAKLPAAVKTRLLVQDISNSQQVLDPATAPIHAVNQVPGRVRRIETLQAIADDLFHRAQGAMEQHLAPPAMPAPVEEAPQAPGVAEKPVVAATLPTETPTTPVQSAEPSQAPSVLSEGQAAPAAAPAAPGARPSGVKVMPFAEEWARGSGKGKAVAKSPVPKPPEPHEMTRAEFVQQHGYASGEDLHVGMARVPEQGEPGYGIENVRYRADEPLAKAVVFRDEKGVARGTLEFSAPGEALGMANKRASILGIYVDPSLRRQGIGTRLHEELEKAGYQPHPLEARMLSTEGAALYHARVVRQALAEEKAVPPEVLKDYVSVVADSPRWLQEHGGGEASQPVEHAVRDALARVGLGGDAMQVAPHEHYVSGAEPGTLSKQLQAADEILAAHEVSYLDTDGALHTIDGLEISHAHREGLAPAATGRPGAAGERAGAVAEGHAGGGQAAEKPAAKGEAPVRGAGGGHPEKARAGREPAAGRAREGEVLAPEAAAQKPLWEMSPAELETAFEQAKQHEQQLYVDLFGAEGAKEYRQMQRRANSSTGSSKEIDAAATRVSQMEAALTPAEQERLFQTAEPGEIRGYQRALGDLDASSAAELGESLKYALTQAGQETDPARMNEREQVAYATLREGMRLAVEHGLDTAEVTKAAVKGAAERFGDANDAAFMLRRFAKEFAPRPAQRAALPATARAASAAGAGAAEAKPAGRLRARRGSIQIGPSLGQNQAPAEKIGNIFDDPELEQWRVENRGQEKLPDQRESLLTRIGHGLTRTHEHLPATPEFHPLQNALIRLEKIHDIAATEAMFKLHDALHELTPADLHLFEGALLLPDLKEDLEHGLPLPAPWTEEKIAAEEPLIAAKVAASPAVQAALARWRQTVPQTWGEWRQSLIDIGAPAPALDRENWFHHQVLQEAQVMAMRPGAPKKLQAILRPGWSLEREGGVPFNTFFIEAHFQALADAIRKTEENKVIKLVQQSYDIRPQLQARAAIGGDAESLRFFQELTRTGRPEHAAALLAGMPTSLAKAAAAGDVLPDDAAGRWAPVIQEIAANYALNQARGSGSPAIPPSPELLPRLADYGHWVLQQYRPERERGPAPDGRMPAGYQPVPIVEGHPFYRTRALTGEAAKLAQAAMDEATKEITVSTRDLRSVLAAGRPVPPMIVPIPVARTIMNLKPQGEPNAIDQAVRRAAGNLKGFAVLNPLHLPTLLREKLLGDAVRILRANPKVFGELPGAIHDIWDVRVNHASPAAEYRQFLFEGGSRGWAQQFENIGEARALNLLAKFARENPSGLKEVWAKVVEAHRMAPDRLDELVRYAAFRAFGKEIDAQGGPSTFGAARPDLTNSLATRSQQAYYLAQHLMGAYDEMPVLLKAIRDRFPAAYWGFAVAQTRSEWRLFTNVFQEPAVRAGIGRKLTGQSLFEEIHAGRKVARSATIIEAMLRFGFKAVAAGALVTALNHYAHEHDEEQMNEPRPHLDLGAGPHGTLLVWPRLGALPNAAGFIGLDDPFGYGQMYLNGHLTRHEVLLQMGRSGWGEFMGLAAQAKLPYELATGRRLSTGGTIMDRGENIADAFHVGLLYRAATGIPQRGGLKGQLRAAAVGAQLKDPAENAYREATFAAKDWVRNEKGIPEQQKHDTEWSPLSVSLFYYKKALQYGDTDGALKALAAFVQAGGTDKKINAALARMEPLYGLTPPQREKYLATLTPSDRAQLRNAYWYWQQFVAPQANVSDARQEKDLQEFTMTMFRDARRVVDAGHAVQSWLDAQAATTAEKVRSDARARAEVNRRFRPGRMGVGR